MSRVFKKIDNTISRSVSHVHDKDEREMEPDELRQHLMKYHGWSLGQIMSSRAAGGDGLGYMRNWHRNDHVPLKRSP